MHKTIFQDLIKIARVGAGLASPENVHLSDDVDWDALTVLANRQGVVAQFADGVKQLPNDATIGKVQKLRLLAAVERCRHNNLQKLEAAKELSVAWKSRGLRTILLKGFAYAKYYPEPMHRSCSDVDVYLTNYNDNDDDNRAAHRKNASRFGDEIAKELGATVDNAEQKHSHIYYKDISIENHYHCCGHIGDKRIRALDDYLINLLKGEPIGTMEGTCLEYPPSLFDALFFMYHAWSHFMIDEGIRLRLVWDWVLIRKQIINEDRFEEFTDLCDQYGLAKFFQAVDGVAAYVSGEITFENLNRNQQLMLENIANFQIVKKEPGRSLFKARFDTLVSIWHNRWKYSLYSDTSVWGMFWIYLKGYLRRLKNVR